MFKGEQMSDADVATGPTAHPAVSPALRSSRLWVGIAYGLQGLLTAVVFANLPGLEERTSIGDSEVSLVLVAGLVMAAVGSLLAGWIAPRRGSAVVLVPAYAIQGIALMIAILPLPFVVLVPVYALFGLGVGLADGGNGMQALVIQRGYGRSIINSLFAWTTGAAMLGALLVAVVNGLGAPFELSFAIAVVLALTLIWPMRKHLVPDPEVETHADAAELPRLPWRGILVFGLVISAVFVGEGAVSAGSSLHLEKTLSAAAWVVPLGYFAYLGGSLVSRLLGDRLANSIGRAKVVTAGIVVAAFGLVAAGMAPAPWFAVIAFGVTGLGLGVLVPVTFTAATDLAPDRTDEIVARLNLFNYGGVLIGSAATGIIADAAGWPIAIALPAAIVLAALFAVPAYRTTKVAA